MTDSITLADNEVQRLADIRNRFERLMDQLALAQQAIETIRAQYRIAELEILAEHALSPKSHQIVYDNMTFRVQEITSQEQDKE